MAKASSTPAYKRPHVDLCSCVHEGAHDVAAASSRRKEDGCRTRLSTMG